MAEAAPPRRPRPLSPFLFPPTGTYRWQMTSTLSILHRASGVALGVGTLLLTWWLLSLLGEPSDFAAVQDFIGSPIGIILLVIGAVLWIMGSMGRSVAGRRHWY